MRTTGAILAVLLLLTLNSTGTASKQLFQQLDQNQNGQIEAAEIQTEHRLLYQRLLSTADNNQDGRLNREEFLAGLQPQTIAKPLVKKQGSELPNTDALLLLLAKMNTNGNGLIEEKEVPEQFLAIFQRIEERLGGEPDGVLDRRDLTQAGPALSHVASRMAERMGLDVELELALLPEKQWQAAQELIKPRRRGDLLANPDQAREYFRRLDANSDGFVTLAEVPEQIADRFENLLDRADRNGDDQISEQELMAVSRRMQDFAKKRLSKAESAQGIQRLLEQFDRNDDGKISEEEAPRRMAARFDRIDQDGNGQLEREELTPIVEVLSRLRRPENRQKNRSESTQPRKN